MTEQTTKQWPHLKRAEICGIVLRPAEGRELDFTGIKTYQRKRRG